MDGGIVTRKVKKILVFLNRYNYHIDMTRFLLFTSLLAAAFAVPALADIPASSVPAPLREQVQKQYPDAKGIEWDFDHDEDVYEAEFRINGLEYELKFVPDGTLRFSKVEIPLQSLPAAVTAAIARDFPGYVPRRAKQITVGRAMKYRVYCRSEAAGTVHKLELYYAPDGKFLSKKTDN